MKHSIQPVRKDTDEVLRFEENPIVRYLLDAGPFDLNQLAITPGFDREDWEHFAQLIGYSLYGWFELDYVSDTTAEVANARASGRSEEQGLRDRIKVLEDCIRTAAKALESGEGE